MDPLRAALDYAGNDWSVIPIRARDKKPLIAWAEFQHRIATRGEIRSWWRRWPTANVGIVTGHISHLVVVDVDTKRGGNAATVEKRWPTELKARTGSGGTHLFYDLPNGRKAFNAVTAKGIDVRGEGGYVVAAPSLHESGKRYTWLEHGTPGAPPEFVFSPAVTAQKSDKRLSQLLQGVGRGERNDACAKLAGYYLSRKIPPDVVLENLLDWNRKNTPPLSRLEVERTIASVGRTQERRPPMLKPSDVTLESTPNEDPFALLNVSDYMVRFGNESVTWSIVDWLPEHTVAMVVAPPGSYKTWLLLDLAVSIAGGRPFLGEFDVLHQGPVIIIQQEDYHGQIAERLGAIIAARYELKVATLKDDVLSVEAPPRLPIYLHPDRRLRFGDAVVLEGLEARVAELRPALVILDPLYSAGATDDFMAGTAQEMFFFKALRDKYGCSFLVAHHTKKRPEKSKGGIEREDLWGSQFLNAFIETGWQVRRKDEPNTALIRRHFKVRAELPEGVLAFDIQTTPPFRYRTLFRTASSEDSKGADLIGIIDERAPISGGDIARLAGMDRSTITRRLNKLLEAKTIIRDADGMYRAVEDLT